MRFEQPQLIEKLREDLLKGVKNPIIRIPVKNFVDENLISMIRKNPLRCLALFEDRIWEELKEYREIRKLMKNIESINIIPDISGFEELFPEITEFSRSFRNFIYKLVRIRCRFLDHVLHKKYIATKIIFECLICGAQFEIPQEVRVRGKYRKPKFCTNSRCKAKSYADFKRVDEKAETFEAGWFVVRDLGQNPNPDREKECYAFSNYDYFYEKIQEINPNDEIEILGVIKQDFADLDSKKDSQEIFDYIEVLDLKGLESKKMDKSILSEIYEGFEKNPDYQDEIVNSIHSYSKNIYEYFLEKLIMVCAWITSDSFEHDGSKRNTINSIIGGHRGLFKSSIAHAFQNILGYNNWGIISGKDTTNKGLIPTTQRANDQKNLIKRIGAIPYYSRKVLVIDEGQYLEDVSLESMKSLEDGKIQRALDGTIIDAPAETAVVMLMNYKGNKEQQEAYDYDKKLYENIGFPEGQESILDRFDIHYAIPKLSKLVKKILRRRLFDPPKQTVSNEKIFNYLNEAKRLYTEGIEISDDMIEIIEELDDTITDSKKDDKLNTPREFKVLLKVIRAIAALRLKKTVDSSDIKFLKKHIINQIIPFYDNSAVSKERLVNINEIFQRTFKLLMELKGNTISITDHIAFIKEWLENHYFPVKPDSRLDPWGVYNYIGKEDNKSNTKYKALLENEQENLEFVQEQGYLVELVKGTTYFVKKSWIYQEIKEKIVELAGEKKSCNHDKLISELEEKSNFSSELIQSTVQDLLEHKFFVFSANKIKLKK